ncbi:unnamed protein product [Moneuplotes crassus]|uniref:Uncharacterized protein n=1 Tax=Euplotes crassus TaxID=5936 RepID=A0AAD1Y9W5_EUPCR|nr:unnamed protein product [Moneuplotes crassus]
MAKYNPSNTEHSDSIQHAQSFISFFLHSKQLLEVEDGVPCMEGKCPCRLSLFDFICPEVPITANICICNQNSTKPKKPHKACENQN